MKKQKKKKRTKTPTRNNILKGEKMDREPRDQTCDGEGSEGQGCQESAFTPSKTGGKETG